MEALRHRGQMTNEITLAITDRRSFAHGISFADAGPYERLAGMNADWSALPRILCYCILSAWRARIHLP